MKNGIVYFLILNFYTYLILVEKTIDTLILCIFQKLSCFSYISYTSWDLYIYIVFNLCFLPFFPNKKRFFWKNAVFLHDFSLIFKNKCPCTNLVGAVLKLTTPLFYEETRYTKPTNDFAFRFRSSFRSNRIGSVYLEIFFNNFFPFPFSSR